MTVEVYRNLREKCWSVRQKGKVIAHSNDLWIFGAFIVQPAGREKVRQTKQKNVHAFVRGILVSPDDFAWIPKKLHRVTYNPYEHDEFVWAEDQEVVPRMRRVVHMTDSGVYAARGL